MILFIQISIDQLSKMGKDFKWGKYFCKECQRNAWGHGFVSRYFSEHKEQVPVKRYRCPGCGKVLTVRPEGYFQSIRSSISTISDILKAKLKGYWPRDFPRQRGGHWLRRFVSFAKMENSENLPAFLDQCFSNQLNFLS